MREVADVIISGADFSEKNKMNATNRGLKPIIYSVRSDNDCAIFACVGCRSVRLYKRIVREVSGVNVNDAIISTKTKCMQQSTADKPILYSKHSNNDC